MITDNDIKQKNSFAIKIDDAAEPAYRLVQGVRLAQMKAAGHRINPRPAVLFNMIYPVYILPPAMVESGGGFLNRLDDRGRYLL